MWFDYMATSSITFSYNEMCATRRYKWEIIIMTTIMFHDVIRSLIVIKFHLELIILYLFIVHTRTQRSLTFFPAKAVAFEVSFGACTYILYYTDVLGNAIRNCRMTRCDYQQSSRYYSVIRRKNSWLISAPSSGSKGQEETILWEYFVYTTMSTISILETL